MADAPRHRRAWERRTGESVRAYQAFTAYLALGPTRTLPQAAEQVSAGIDSVRKWSAAHDWRLRAAAHDEHYEALYWRAADDEAAEMGRRHVQVAQEALGVVLHELNHVKRLQAARATILRQLPADPSRDDRQQKRLRAKAEQRHLTGRDMAVLIKAAADLEHRVTVVEGATKGADLDAELERATPGELREQLAELTGLSVEELAERGL